MYSPARPGHVCVLCLTCSERTATDVLTIYRPKPTQTAICKYLSLFYPINARSNDRGCQAVLKNFLQTSTGIPYEYALTKYFLGAVHTVSMNYGCHHMRKRRALQYREQPCARNNTGTGYPVRVSRTRCSTWKLHQKIYTAPGVTQLHLGGNVAPTYSSTPPIYSSTLAV